MNNEFELWYRKLLIVEAANMKKDIEKLQEENKRLKEALKKCNPFKLMSHPEAKCVFCDNDDELHKPDCEYIKLIGGIE